MENIKIGDKVKYVGTIATRQNKIGQVINIKYIEKNLYRVDVKFDDRCAVFNSDHLNYKDMEGRLVKYIENKPTFKEGDRVIYCGNIRSFNGKIGIVKSNTNIHYPILVHFGDLGAISFTLDGREFLYDTFPSIRLCKEPTFKLGDTVYDWNYGKGIIDKINYEKDPYPIVVKFNNGAKINTYTKEGKNSNNEFFPRLSFTPYDLVSGGFSQERPLPDIEKDTLIYVKGGAIWLMRYFSHWNHNKVCCFVGQKTSKETSDTCYWREWSLTNPLEE